MKLSKRHGSNIGIYFAQDEDPLDWATFGAFCSRNNGSFEELLDKVTSGSKQRIIEQTFIGYGHASIGDLVDVKMFLEGVPIWLAFELEGFSRFRGQESSTRYIDFSNQKLMPYYANQLGVLEWYAEKMADYVSAFDKVCNRIAATIPGDVEYGLHYRAVRARAFDICRSLIPSICTTNVVWYGSINELRQHLSYLQSKNLPFVSEIIYALNDQYPETKPLKKVRFRKPWASANSEEYTLFGHLDFGSYRDLRRHRIGTHRVTERQVRLLHMWYRNMFQMHEIDIKPTNEYNGGALISFDECVPLLGNTYVVSYGCDEDQASYLSFLRTKTNVHATLRHMVITQWSKYPDLEKVMTLSKDVGPFGYYLVRGSETIEFKGD